MRVSAGNHGKLKRDGRHIVTDTNNPRWLEWARRLISQAQSGLTYSSNPYDIERYQAVRVIAEEMLAAQTGTELPVIKNLIESQAGYATPKVDVRGVVFQNDAVLLVREMADGGLYTLPGGWVDVGEPPSRAAEREVWEESGYKVKAVKLLALLDRDRHGHPPHPFHIYKLFFLCELMGGAAKDSYETSGASFFKEDAIPPLSVGRVTEEEIRRLFVHHRQPDLPTDFD
jgi:ADP-ribose pyrophosphatase YjhB (NUDIX family)